MLNKFKQKCLCKKGFALFMAIISIISVNIIAALIICFEMGFSLAIWKNAMTVIPFVRLGVISLVLLTYVPSEKIIKAITGGKNSTEQPTD